MHRLSAYLILLFGAACLSLAQSDQQCYYAKGKRAGSAIVPCTPEKGITSCCQSGDLCLTDGACWNPPFNITYQYGCTDPTYADAACPGKCDLNTDLSNWVGLMFCGNLQWACNHPDTCGNCPGSTTWNQAIMSLPPHDNGCPDLKTTAGAFVAPISIEPILSLPTNPATPTLYFSQLSDGKYTEVTGYTPAWVTAAAATTAPTGASATSAETSRSTSSGASETSPPAAPAASSNSSTIGIAVGVSVGALVLIAAAAAFFILRRRRQKKNKPEPEAAAPPPSEEKKPDMASVPNSAGWPSSPAFSELHSEAKSRPISEMPSVTTGPNSPAPTYQSWGTPHTPHPPHAAELSTQPAVIYELPSDAGTGHRQ